MNAIWSEKQNEATTKVNLFLFLHFSFIICYLFGKERRARVLAKTKSGKEESLQASQLFNSCSNSIVVKGNNPWITSLWSAIYTCFAPPLKNCLQSIWRGLFSFLSAQDNGPLSSDIKTLLCLFWSILFGGKEREKESWGFSWLHISGDRDTPSPDFLFALVFLFAPCQRTNIFKGQNNLVGDFIRYFVLNIFQLSWIPPCPEISVQMLTRCRHLAEKRFPLNAIYGGFFLLMEFMEYNRWPESLPSPGPL